jgi:hypothetical protein
LVVAALASACGEDAPSERLSPPVSDAGGAARDGGTPASDAGTRDGGAPAAACGLPIVPGDCLALVPRYAFDAALGHCAPFTYGGCRGNANNFETLEACQATCGGVATVCDPRGGGACGPREFCEFVGTRCEAARAGVCIPRPQGCTDEHEPVCGCDGETYANLCLAHRAGVTALFSGPC